MSRKSSKLASNSVISTIKTNTLTSSAKQTGTDYEEKENQFLRCLLDLKDLNQVSGCGAQHISASEDPFSIYGLHMH